MMQIGRSPLDPWIELELATGGRRTLLVDGFNVLHTVLLAGARDVAWWGRKARERLLERVAGWPEAGDAIWVAFDGSQPAWSVLALEFKGPSAEGSARGPIVHGVFVESADDWIVRRARRAEAPDRTIVVSADRKVAGRARSAGCLVWSPRAFIAACGEPGAETNKAQAVYSSEPAPDPFEPARTTEAEGPGPGRALDDEAEVGAPPAPRLSPTVAS